MLADEFFTIAHDEHTGAAHLPLPVVALGLASAILADLMLDRRIIVHRGQLAPLALDPPADPLLMEVHARFIQERRPQPIRIWLAYLATFTYPRVAQRLAAAGAVQPQRRLTLSGWSTRYRPVNWQRAAWTGAALAEKLMRRQPLGLTDMFLAGLGRRTALLDLLLRDFDSPAAGRAYLQQLEPHIWAPLLELLEHTDAAVANAMVTHRS